MNRIARLGVLLVWLAVLAGTAATALPPASKPGEPLALARQSYQRHDYKQAVEVLDRFLAGSPGQEDRRLAVSA